MGTRAVEGVPYARLPREEYSRHYLMEDIQCSSTNCDKTTGYLRYIQKGRLKRQTSRRWRATSMLIWRGLGLAQAKRERADAPGSVRF
jgi:hypothetical protein